MQQNKVCDQLKALSQITRLQVFRALHAASPEGISAGDLCESFNISCSAMSFHLNVLSAADLINSTREGRHIIYSADRPEARKLVNFLFNNCCQHPDK